jgi:hypothetical protein
MSDLARTRYKIIVTEKSPYECSDPSFSYSSSPLNTPPRIEEDIPVTMPETASECGFQGSFDDAETPDGTPDRHCWSCKEEVGDTDRCPSCGWIPCSCGACSPECPHGGEGGRVEVEV